MAKTEAKLVSNAISPLLIFDTHPIQYRSPVFRELARKSSRLKVYFFNENFDGKKWWFHEVGKIPKQEWALDLKAGFDSEVLNSRNGLLEFSKTIRTILTGQRPGSVLIYGYYLPEHWIIRHWCKKLGVPLLFIGETFSAGGTLPRRLLKSILQPLFFSAVSGCISIGEKSLAFYRRFLPENSVTRAKYAVDTSFFRLSSEDARQARARIRLELGIAENAFLTLFVGRIFDRKRPQDVVALQRELGNEPLHHTLVIGNGPDEEKLKSDSQGLERFHFLGFKNQNEIRDYYHAVDLLFVPSEYETWGLVINEAMSAGTPALVTGTCGAAGDLVLDGQTGGVFMVGDLKAAAQFVRRCLKDRTYHAALGARARAKVTSEYDTAQFANAIYSAFERVTGN